MTTVLAYLDPGSGSMILQILAGGLAAVAVTAKLYWGRILRFLRIRKDEPETAEAGRLGSSEAPALGLAYFSAGCPRRPRPPALEPGLVPRPREPRLLLGRRGLPRALARRAERLRGARGDAACSTTSASSRPSAREDAAALGGLLVHEPAAVLRHERIPFVSYPYEWTFSMLKDAALLQLDLLLAALEHDLVLKDSTPYNVQFKGAQPCSWTSARSSASARASPGSATASSACSTSTRCCSSRRRACRSSPGCAARSTASRPRRCAALMSFRDRFRKGVFTNVFLHARLEERYADRPQQVKQEVKRVFKKELFVANVRKMRKLVERLVVGPAAGRLDRLRRAQQLHRRRREAQGRVRPRGGHEPRRGPSSGTSAATTAATRASPPRARGP